MHGGCDGSFGSRRLFNCPPNQGLFAQLNEVIKYDDFLFANPGKIRLFNFITSQYCTSCK